MNVVVVLEVVFDIELIVDVELVLCGIIEGSIRTALTANNITTTATTIITIL
jgi:hypothetical protein